MRQGNGHTCTSRVICNAVAYFKRKLIVPSYLDHIFLLSLQLSIDILQLTAFLPQTAKVVQRLF